MQPTLREKLYGKAKSLAEKLADFADKAEDKVTGTAMLGAGIVSRSNALTGKGLEKLTGRTVDETINEPKENIVDVNQQENNIQKSIARQSGYDSDEVGNPTQRLSFKERVQIANEFPGVIGGNLFSDEERNKMIDVTEEQDNGFIDKAKRVMSDKPLKKTITIKPGFENHGQEIQIETRPTPIDFSKDMPNKPPEQYQNGVDRALRHLNRFSSGLEKEPSGRKYENIDTNKFLAKIALEGNWNPTAGNKEHDYGMTQLNKSKRQDLRDTNTIWGKSWKNNFEKEYGKFNEDDPTHQLLGASVVLAVARQKMFDAFEKGEIKRPPSVEDIFVAYNMDYKQVLDAIKGKDYSIEITDNNGKKITKSLQEQYHDYLNALKTKGF